MTERRDDDLDRIVIEGIRNAIQDNPHISPLNERSAGRRALYDAGRDDQAAVMGKTINQLALALGALLECTDEPPEASCRCHIAPPCNDCVNYAGMREVIAEARAALEAALSVTPKREAP